MDIQKKRIAAALLSTTLVFGTVSCTSDDNPDTVEEEIEDEIREEHERGEEIEDELEDELNE